jgi:Arginase/agmatinase/formimionoglutamate hydrolase, arginase family
LTFFFNCITIKKTPEWKAFHYSVQKEERVLDNFSTKKPVNMAPTGIASFAKSDICTDIHNLNADIAIIGAPFDLAIQGRTGTRLGPRGIRIASTRFSYKKGGTYDPERNEMYLDSSRWKIVDCGDVDYVPGDITASFENLTEAVHILTSQGIMPVVLGGDHSITYPVIKGMKIVGPFDIIHIDAHLDWTNSIGGQTLSNGSPMRNVANLPYIGKIIHLGIRGIGSSGPSDFADAQAHGDKIYSVKATRSVGIKNILTDLPTMGKVFITFDIDGMDAACAPATGSPMFGGFLYDEIVEILEAVAKHSRIIGFDMVEVAPPYDDAGETTSYLAARLISDLLGFVTKECEHRGLSTIK